MGMFNDVFSKEEVNTGRQVEFDYLKGLFMLFIFLIHAFQATFSKEGLLVSWIYILATTTGAAIFIFVMGFGTVYSRNSQPNTLVKNGIQMIIYQYLNNLLYIVSLALPYPFVRASLSTEGEETFRLGMWVYVQYVNIFFITGIIYLVLALFKKLKLPVWGYLVAGIVISIAAPFIYGIHVDIPVLGYILGLLIGEEMYVSFTPLYFVSYALIGVSAGHCYRHIKDQDLFYKRILPVCIIIAAGWWISLYVRFKDDFDGLRSFSGASYIHPSLFRVAASLAHIIIFAVIFYYLHQKNVGDDGSTKPASPVTRQVLYYSSNISKYYALHIVVYFIAFGVHGYTGFTTLQCWLLMLLSMIVTEAMVRGYNAFLKNRREKADARKKS